MCIRDSVYDDAARATAQALNFLKMRALESDERPFFMYLHYMDTHEPYCPPASFRRKFLQGKAIEGIPDSSLVGAIRRLGMKRGLNELTPQDAPIVERARDMYLASANYVDCQVGKLIRFLKEKYLYHNSIVVFTADHGEEFGEHGWIGHSRTLYREVLEVPLVMAGPGIARGAVVDGIVASVDIVPALARMAIGAGAASFEGEAGAIIDGCGNKDIVSSVQHAAGASHPDYHALAVTTRTAKRYIRTRHLDKSGNITSIEHELYDLRRDRAELNNLAAEHADFCASAASEINAQLKRRENRSGMVVQIPKESQEALRSLGYLN